MINPGQINWPNLRKSLHPIRTTRNAGHLGQPCSHSHLKFTKALWGKGYNEDQSHLGAKERFCTHHIRKAHEKRHNQDPSSTIKILDQASVSGGMGLLGPQRLCGTPSHWPQKFLVLLWLLSLSWADHQAGAGSAPPVAFGMQRVMLQQQDPGLSCGQQSIWAEFWIKFLVCLKWRSLNEVWMES